MKKLIIALFLIIILVSCKKNESDPVQIIPQEKKIKISLSAYTSYLDSTYYKEWSNGDWTKYKGIETIGGTKYLTIINKAGNVYYYSSEGYSGFKSSTLGRIMFTSAIRSLPDTVEVGRHYFASTTFLYAGSYYNLSTNYTFLDTTTTRTYKLGNFYSSLHFKVESKAGSDSEDSDVWIAKDISDVRYEAQNKSSIEVFKAVLNGRKWGYQSAKTVNAANIYSEINEGNKILILSPLHKTK